MQLAETGASSRERMDPAGFASQSTWRYAASLTSKYFTNFPQTDWLTMLVHVARRVENTALPYSRSLLPIFEAVINSMHAIEDAETGGGQIEVHLVRDLTLLDVDTRTTMLPDVVSVSIVDNGIGFTPANQKAFAQIDTPYKRSRGGKGLGRLSWLKAFDRAEVDSVYMDDGKRMRCTFSFQLTEEGVHDLRVVEAANDELLTTIRLIGLRREYRPHYPKRADTIGRRIIEHCLHYFILGTMPRVRLIDPQLNGEIIDLSSVYETDYKPRQSAVGISIQGQQFHVHDVFLKDTGDTDHSIHLCASGRPVKSISLTSRVPHLDGRIEDDQGNALKYAAYVTSPFLEERVNGERTDFSIDSRDELRFRGGISLEDIIEGVTGYSAGSLKTYTGAARERAAERLTKYIREEAPEYRHLLKHAPIELENIPASEDKLNLALHKIDASWRAGLMERGERLLRQADETPTLAAQRAQYQQFFEQLTDAVKSDLAQYVVRRRLVLAFLEKQIQKQEDGKFPEEATLHSLIMPLRRTSDDVQDDEQNLWLLDERLAYHVFLASDIPFEDQRGPVDVDGRRRPDMLLYNKAMVFAEGEDIINSAIIVEFKRPERREYQEDDDPIQQVYDYIELIRSGRARLDTGRPIRIRERLPFYCFVVADLTPKIQRFAKRANLIPSPEGEGYFGFNTEYGAYVEVLSYDKVLRDAKRRNRAFFAKLGIPLR